MAENLTVNVDALTPAQITEKVLSLSVTKSTMPLGQ